MLISKIYRDARTYLIVAVTLIALALVCDHRPGATLLHTSAHPYHLFLAFVFGNLAFHFRAHIPSNAWIFFGCAMAGLALIQNTSFVILGIAALTYCTVWLGLQRLPLPRLLNSGDYSYGVYLYAYPVQQLTMHWLPQMRQWYWNILIAAPITFCFALFSWHCIESPTLALKSRMKSLASYEVVLLSNPLVRFGLAVGFLAYAVLLLHWSAFDLSVGINFTKLPYTVLATIAVIALLVAAASALHRPRKAALADAAA
jgi:peptidoglycan/LPS O-acetylase OafA/YrhL